MLEEIDYRQEETSQNNSFEDNYNDQISSDINLFSREDNEDANEYFESEFKKVFNDKDIFGKSKREEEKEFEPEKKEQIRFNKKKIFKLIYNANQIVNKKSNFKKKIFTIFSKDDFHNYSYNELILYIKKLNASSKSSSSALNKLNILKLEHKLITELKTRILNKIKENEKIK